MAYTEPVLLKRIDPDPSKRKTHWYDDYVATGGYAALRKAIELTPEQITKTMIDSGLRGRGGAGFSAGQKWSFIPKEKKGIRITWRLMPMNPNPALLRIDICSPTIRIRCSRASRFVHWPRRWMWPTSSSAVNIICRRRLLERAIKEAYEKGIFGQQGIFGSAKKGGMLSAPRGRRVHLR